MSDYGTPPPPEDPNQGAWGQQPPPNQPPYGQPAYGQPAYGQPAYGAPQAVPYADWPKRALGYLIDLAILLPFYLVAGIGAGIGGGFGGLLMAIGYLAAIGVAIWNIVIKQGATGQTIGKGVIGTKLISEATGQPLGAAMTFVRQLLHIVDSVPCIPVGYLWPLWDEKRQTFADKILKTIVIVVPK